MEKEINGVYEASVKKGKIHFKKLPTSKKLTKKQFRNKCKKSVLGQPKTDRSDRSRAVEKNE